MLRAPRLVAKGLLVSQEAVIETIRNINRTWLDGRPQEMRPPVHLAITMAIPGFAGSVSGAPLEQQDGDQDSGERQDGQQDPV
jgi:hypothetical protein